MCKFRGANFGQFFYGADNLGEEVYDPRTIMTSTCNVSKREKIVALALACGLEIDYAF